MSGRTATTLAFVRTSAGVVKVDPGETLPEGLLEGEVERLGSVVATKGSAKVSKPRQQGSSDS